MGELVRVHGERTRAGLSTLKAGIHQAITLTLRSAVDAAKGSAKATDLWKNRTGETRASIRGEVLGLKGFVEARGAAHFLEWGTAPHLIVAHGRALRFVVNGTVLYRKWVHHPGTRERPFMREARQRGEQAAAWGAEIFVGAAIRAAH